MNITDDVINDLLPLYASGECSADTKLLVDEYLRAHPDLARQVSRISQQPPAGLLPNRLGASDEMYALKKTRRMIKRRSYILGAAIFFTIAPFSFAYINGKFYWLMAESPMSAAVYLIVGAAFWVGYAVLKIKARDL